MASSPDQTEPLPSCLMNCLANSADRTVAGAVADSPGARLPSQMVRGHKRFPGVMRSSAFSIVNFGIE